MSSVGGTSFNTALTHACNIVLQNKNSDIIMLTDGECGVKEHIREIIKEQKDRVGMRIWGILIGNDVFQTSEFINICDGVVEIDENGSGEYNSDQSIIKISEVLGKSGISGNQ